MADDGPQRDEAADAKRLRELTNELIETLTSHEYLAEVRAVSEAPEEERLMEASRRLSVDAMRERGVDLPDAFRVSSRYFEADWPAAIELGDYADGRPNPILERNLTAPGELDKLRLEDPEKFWRLVTDGRAPDALQVGTTVPSPPGGGPRPHIAMCGGAGVLSICGCGGQTIVRPHGPAGPAAQ